ncbi:MAG: hypothetical protein U1A78_15530 [Polyangia bacterium]
MAKIPLVRTPSAGSTYGGAGINGPGSFGAITGAARDRLLL